MIIKNVRQEQHIKEDNHYKNLINRIPIGTYLFVSSPDGSMRFDFVSPKFCQILDMAEEDLLRDPSLAFSVTHPDDSESLIKANQYVTENGESFHWEGRYVVNEKIIWVEISSEPSLLDNGDILFSGIISDISERKASEEARIKSSKEWSIAMDFFEDAIYLIDLDDKIVRANRAFYEMTGLTPESAIGSDISAILHPDGEEIPCPVCQARKERHDAVITMEADHPDNPMGRPIQVTVRIIRDNESNPLGVLMGIRDLSRIREDAEDKARLQRELHQAQKMDALGNLTGGIAHDFNNILGIIMGNVSLAQAGIGEVDASQLDRHLKTIQTASERARDLVAQMMAFSRSDIGELRPLELTPMIKEDIKMLQPMLPTSIQIIFDYQKSLPKVMMDPVKLQQILMNICVNAKDAMNSIGTLAISLGMRIDVNQECSTCYEQLTGDWLEITISDTGMGIDTETTSRIFEPFYTTKEVGKGTGMGLAVVNSTVKSLHGHLIVESERGKGTTFRILFPPVQFNELVELDESPQHIALDGDGQSILIVDDEPDFAEVISEMLAAYGYQPTVMTSSLEAFKLFESSPTSFELIITDQTMPELTGIELVTKIQNIRPEIPIIIATGYSDTINQNEAEQQGLGFLRKPVTLEKLTNMVAGMLQKP